MSQEHAFFVAGLPVPKGSTKSFLHRNSGRIVTMQTNREKQIPWKEAIVLAARQAGVMQQDGPIRLELCFNMPRPKSHFNKAGVKPSAPHFHTSKPDLDKLERMVFDALTGVAYKDDNQVCGVTAKKAYAGNIGVSVVIAGEQP